MTSSAGDYSDPSPSGNTSADSASILDFLKSIHTVVTESTAELKCHFASVLNSLQTIAEHSSYFANNSTDDAFLTELKSILVSVDAIGSHTSNAGELKSEVASLTTAVKTASTDISTAANTIQGAITTASTKLSNAITSVTQNISNASTNLIEAATALTNAISVGNPEIERTDGINPTIDRLARRCDEGRPFSGVPVTMAFVSSLVLAMVALHTFSRRDGFPAKTHLLYIRIMVFSIIGFCIFAGAMLIPPPTSRITFYFGFLKMLCLLVIFGALMVLFPWPLIFPSQPIVAGGIVSANQSYIEFL